MCQKTDMKNEDRLKQYLEWIYKINRSIQGSDSIFDVSAKKLQDYKNCPGDLLMDWKTFGYKTIFDFFLVIEKYK